MNINFFRKGKKMKKLWILCCVALVVGIVGCQQPTRQDIAVLAGEVKSLSGSVDDVQDSVIVLQETITSTPINESGKTIADVVGASADTMSAVNEKIDDLNSEVDRVQGHIEGVATALANRPPPVVKPDDWRKGILEAAELARDIAPATAPFNPYAGLITTAAGIIIAVFGGAFGVKKGKEAEVAKKQNTENLMARLDADVAKRQAERKYQAHKQGVEKTMKEVSASPSPAVQEVETQLYSNIGEARKTVGV